MAPNAIAIQSTVAELRQRKGYLTKRLAELNTFIALKETQFDGRDTEWVQAKWERTQKRRELRSVLFNLEMHGQLQLVPNPSGGAPFVMPAT